jgi:hypothetical protein
MISIVLIVFDATKIRRKKQAKVVNWAYKQTLANLSITAYMYGRTLLINRKIWE